MRMHRRLSALLLCLVMLLSLAACGEADPAQVVAKASEKAASAKSVSTSTAIRVESTIAGQALSMSYVIDLDAFMDPLKAHCTSTIDMIGQNVPQEMYLAKVDGRYLLYVNSRIGWCYRDMGLEAMPQLNAQRVLDAYLGSLEDVKDGGTETLENGTKAHRYDSVIRGEALSEAFRASGAMEAVSVTDDDTMLKALLKGRQDLKLSLWVDEGTGYPVRISMDMTDMANAVMKNIGGIAGSDLTEAPFTKLTIVTDYHSFNAVEDFDLPADASSLD